MLVCIGTSKVDCVISKLKGGAVNVTSNTGTGDVSAAGNNTFSGDNSFTGPVHFLGTDSVYFSSIINSGYGISGTSYSLKSDSLVSPETTKLLVGGTTDGANTTSYGVGQIINKQATLTLPTTSGTLATTNDIPVVTKRYYHQVSILGEEINGERGSALFFETLSDKNTSITNLSTLKTVMGNTFSHSATGHYLTGVICAITELGFRTIVVNDGKSSVSSWILIESGTWHDTVTEL